jgi:phosphoribosylformylglycinamidine synthase PurS subunit
MKAKIYVTLRSGVLDPQGKAVSQALQNLGFAGVEDVRIGKYIELELADNTPDIAQQTVKEMCEALLANTVMEEYRIELA